MPRPIRKKQGSTFFWGDWLNDRELASCSLEAQALWMRILCVMFFQNPQGVLENGLETYVKYEYPDPMISQLKMKSCTPFMAELIEKEVCSFGKDMPGALPFESIVSRRMYRAWLDAQDKSARCRLAVNTRWKNERKEKTRKIGSHTESFKKDTEGDTDGTLEGYEQVIDDDRLVANPEYERDTGGALAGFSSYALSPSIENQPTDPSSLLADSLPVVRAKSTQKPSNKSRCPGNQNVTAIGDVLKAILPETSLKPKPNDTTKVTPGEATTTVMLMELTGDMALGQPRTRGRIQKILEAKGGREGMNTLISKLKEPMEDKSTFAQAGIKKMLYDFCGIVAR